MKTVFYSFLVFAFGVFSISSTQAQNCDAEWLYQASVFGTVSFIDISTSGGSITSWYWDFGDGNTSTVQNPQHQYNSMNPYYVCLTITDNNNCTDTWCDTIRFTPGGGGGGGGSQCSASFWPNVNGLTVDFTSSVSGFTGAVSYDWDLGDGNTSTQAHPTHTYGNAGTYTICLIASDTGCADTTCATITLTGGGGGSGNLTGSVYMGGTGGVMVPADHAKVWLISVVPDTVLGDTILTAVDSVILTPNDQGAYSFSVNSLFARDYLVKAALESQSANYSTNLPTYHGDVLFWSDATVLNMTPLGLFGINVNLVQGNNPGGQGFIGGLVSQGANKTSGVGDPMAGIQVMLLDMMDQPVAYVYTDAAGEFEFDNLAYGTYQIYAEVLGKETVPAIVTIDANTPSNSSTDIQVGKDDVVASLAMIGEESIYFNIYPNPVANHVTVQFESDEKGIMELTDLQGRAVLSEIQIDGNSVQLDVESLPSGLYHITVTTEQGVHTHPVIKK